MAKKIRHILRFFLHGDRISLHLRFARFLTLCDSVLLSPAEDGIDACPSLDIEETGEIESERERESKKEYELRTRERERENEQERTGKLERNKEKVEKKVSKSLKQQQTKKKKKKTREKHTTPPLVMKKAGQIKRDWFISRKRRRKKAPQKPK